jgi:hypothetical protein
VLNLSVDLGQDEARRQETGEGKQRNQRVDSGIPKLIVAMT